MGCPYLTRLAYQILCSRLAKRILPQIVSNNSTDIFIAGDPCSASDSYNFSVYSAISGNTQSSCFFINTNNTAHIRSVTAHNAATDILVFSNLDHTAVSTCDSTDIITGSRNICIAGVLSYHTFGQIPADDSTQILITGNGLS